MRGATYQDVVRQVEAVVLRMVAEGRAEPWGVGPHGPVYVVDPDELMERAGVAGLVEERPFEVAFAVARLRAEVAA